MYDGVLVPTDGIRPTTGRDRPASIRDAYDRGAPDATVILASSPRPGLRDWLRTALGGEQAAFRERLSDRLDGASVAGAATARDRLSTEPAAASLGAFAEAVDTPRERRLAWRAWVVDRLPIGVTLTGAAYHDNPLLYANAGFRALTGYDAAALAGQNPRLLQTDATDRESVADFVEALRTWEPVTVEIRNERADGVPFDNRVSLVPVTGADGTVENWFGLQAAVAWPEGRPEEADAVGADATTEL